MLNTYSIHGNEIWIDAPGNSNTNRLRNDLIWAINGYLSTQFDLFAFHVQRKLPEGALYKRISSVPVRYAVFQELDDMFVHPSHLSDEEVEQYRKIIDPLGKMADDVFISGMLVMFHSGLILINMIFIAIMTLLYFKRK